MEGMNPDWNQILRFKITPKTKGQAFTCQELFNPSSYLNISLFDSLSSIKNRRDNPNKFTLSITKHFLGNFRIPLMYLFHNQKIEAAFKIQRPLILFGYYNSQNDAILNQFSEEPEINITNPTIPTYLHLNLSVDPILEIPNLKNESDYFPGYEDTQFLIMGSNWLDKVKTNRNYGKRQLLLIFFFIFFLFLFRRHNKFFSK
jgi:coiled-coil and C2 domain-containing protein 2A